MIVYSTSLNNRETLCFSNYWKTFGQSFALLLVLVVPFFFLVDVFVQWIFRKIVRIFLFLLYKKFSNNNLCVTWLPKNKINIDTRLSSNVNVTVFTVFEVMLLLEIPSKVQPLCHIRQSSNTPFIWRMLFHRTFVSFPSRICSHKIMIFFQMN